MIADMKQTSDFSRAISPLRQKRIFARLVLILLPAAIIVALIVPSCKDQSPTTSDLILPDSNISYSRDIDPLFAQTCLGSQCHSGSAPADNLNLLPPSCTTLEYFNPPLFVPHDTNSLILQWLDGRRFPQMPMNRPPLTQNQLHAVKQWIIEGKGCN